MLKATAGVEGAIGLRPSLGFESDFAKIEATNMSGTISGEIATPRILAISLNEDYLILELEDGRILSVPIAWYPRLVHGTEAERQNFQISSAGFGIHWPELDEDIGVAGLLLGKKSTESPESFQRWLARRSALVA